MRSRPRSCAPISRFRSSAIRKCWRRSWRRRRFLACPRSRTSPRRSFTCAARRRAVSPGSRCPWTAAILQDKRAMSPPDRPAAACGIGGSVVLLVGTRLHPMRADPNDAVAAFTEYAADRPWIASHLIQLAGVALIVAALLLLSRRLEATKAAPWSRFAAAGAIASLGVVTALQAVDGVALKAMVDTWAAAPAGQKDAAFYAALAVRRIEIGLASTASLLFGLTVIAYGIALLRA